jgi:Ca2+/H+ antiporter
LVNLFSFNSFYSVLFLEIKDKLLHTEIILSAIITALIYSIQLFFGMKKYRKDITEYREKGLKSMIKERGISRNHARSKAIQYPGYVIRYTLGGFVITFHLLIFVTFIPRLIWRHFYAFGWILEFLLPILISYALQSLTAKLSSRLVDTHNQTDPESVNIAERQTTQNTPVNRSQWKDDLKNNLKNILQYFILVASKTL